MQFLLLGLLFFWPGQVAGFGVLDFMFEFLGVLFILIGLVYVVLAIRSIFVLSLPKLTGKGIELVKQALRVVWPEPAAEAKLITTGVFKRSRHPIYSGLLWIGYAIGLASGPWPQLFLAIALHVVLFYKAGYEETLLEKKFKDYKKYATTAGRFLPKGDD